MIKIKILGINVAVLEKEEVMAKIKEFLADGRQHLIVTPNPEIILKAQKDEELYYILNSADLSLADGFGLKAASWLEGKNIKRLTGADLSIELLSWCEKEKLPVGFIIQENGLSSKNDLKKALNKKYPNLIFSIETTDSKNAFNPGQELLSINPQVLFLTLGCPWQEKTAFHLLPKMKSVKIAIGVGGTIDYITGRLKRAPKIFRALGMEWLWRLLKQPKRIGRIWKAVAVFPWLVLKRKFIHPFFYRPNISCLLYKKEKDKYKILLVEREGEPNHWQLPQGGTDGEDLLTAGARELREEINCDRFIPKRVYKNIFKYKFGHRPGETASQALNRRRTTGYKGQKQGLFIAEFFGNDKDIKLNFWDHSNWRWIESDKLINEVHLVRRRSAECFLAKFKEFIKQK